MVLMDLDENGLDVDGFIWLLMCHIKVTYDSWMVLGPQNQRKENIPNNSKQKERLLPRSGLLARNSWEVQAMAMTEIFKIERVEGS